METVISIGDIHGDFKVILEVLFNELHKRKGINKLMFQLVANGNVINIATITKSQFEINQVNNSSQTYQENINSVFELIKDLIFNNILIFNGDVLVDDDLVTDNDVIFNNNLSIRDRLLSYHYQLVIDSIPDINSFFNDFNVIRKLIILGDIFDTRNEPRDSNRRICECFDIKTFKYDSFRDFLLRNIRSNETINNLAIILIRNKSSLTLSFRTLIDLLNTLINLIIQNNNIGINRFISRYSMYINSSFQQPKQISDDYITPIKSDLYNVFYHKLLFYLVFSYLTNNVKGNIIDNIRSILDNYYYQQLKPDNLITKLNVQYDKLIYSLHIPLWHRYYRNINNIKCELVKDVFEILTFKMIEFIKISVDGFNANWRFNHNNIFLIIGNHDAKYNLLNDKYSFIGDNIDMFVDYYKFNNTIYSHFSRNIISNNRLNYGNILVNELEICFKIFKSIVNGNIDYHLLQVFISFYDNLLIHYRLQITDEHQLIFTKIKLIIDCINNLNPNESLFNPLNDRIDKVTNFIDDNEKILFNNIKNLTNDIFYHNILFLLNRYVNVISYIIQNKRPKIRLVELTHFDNLFNKLNSDSLYQIHGHTNTVITKNIISLDIRMSRFKNDFNCKDYFKELKYCYLKHQIIDNKNVLIYYTTAYDNNTSNMYLATFGNQYIESVKNNVIFRGNNRVNNELFRINDSTRLVINDNVYVQPNSDVIKKNMFNIGGDNVDLNYYLFIRFPDGLINLKSKDKLLALVDKFINNCNNSL